MDTLKGHFSASPYSYGPDLKLKTHRTMLLIFPASTDTSIQTCATPRPNSVQVIAGASFQFLRANDSWSLLPSSSVGILSKTDPASIFPHLPSHCPSKPPASLNGTACKGVPQIPACIQRESFKCKLEHCHPSLQASRVTLSLTQSENQGPMTSTPGRKRSLNQGGGEGVRKCRFPGTESHSVRPEQRWDAVRWAGRSSGTGRPLEGAAEQKTSAGSPSLGRSNGNSWGWLRFEDQDDSGPT